MAGPKPWEVAAQARLAQGLPSGGVFIPKPADPTDPYKGPRAAADLTRTQQEIAAANATAGATTREKNAQAAKAELDLKNAQEAYAAQHPKGSNATVLGPDALKAMSGPDQEIVKALGSGRLAFPGGSAMRSPWWQQKLEQVAQVFPDFDATNYNQRAKARAILLNGKVGTAANALNTAIGHTGHLSEQGAETASHSFTPFNTLQNLIAETFGSSGPTNFKDTAGKLASELTSAYRNGGGAEQDVIRGLQSLDPNMSAEQKRGIIENTIELLASKQAANIYQYGLGMGGKADIDLLDPAAHQVLNQFPDIRDKYFAPLPALSGQAAGLLTSNGGTPPPAGPSGGTAGPSGSGDGPPPIVPHDYSAMQGGPQATAAQGETRTVYDKPMADALSGFIRKGAPFDTVATFLQSHGWQAPDPKAYAEGVAYAKANGGKTNVHADRTLPTTIGERMAASPLAAGFTGAVSGATAGLADVAGRTVAGPEWDANRAALAAANPKADLAGNLVGGVASAIAAPELAGRYFPGAMGKVAALAEENPLLARGVGNGLYGGTYGASENPDDPVKGGLLGAITGAGAGEAGYRATRGLANVIAPPVGDFAPLYAAGVRPTPGQRFAGSGLPGRIINGTEQAMQSFPILGAAPAAARQATRDTFQVGAFNKSLKELEPFKAVGVDLPTALPAGVGPGTEAHGIAHGAFGQAYDAARSGMQFHPDPQYLADASNFTSGHSYSLLNDTQRAQLKNIVDTSVVSRLKANGGTLNGDQYKAAASELGSASSKLGRTDPLLSDALGEYTAIFDNAARRNSSPDAVNLLDAADRGYAQFVRIQRASEAGGAGKDAGTFTPVNYAGAVKQMGGGVRSSAYNSGNALGQDYANAGLNLRETLADSGTPMRLGVIGGLQGAEGVGLAATGHLGMLLNPKALAAFAPYAPGVRKVTNALIAPREYTLPPALSQPLNLMGSKVNQIAPYIGAGFVPGALALRAGQ